MSYQDVFTLFKEQVMKSIREGSFAKLTMAKTIGKPDLKNIFVRPINSNEGVKVLLKFRYRLKEIEDVEEELTIGEAFEVLESHLRKPFLSVLMFTTTKDVIFKINKKGAGSITESHPSFHDVTLAVKDVT